MSKNVLIIGGSNVFSEQVANYLSPDIECEVDTLFVEQIFEENSAKIRRRYTLKDFSFEMVKDEEGLYHVVDITNYRYMLTNINSNHYEFLRAQLIYHQLISINKYDIIFLNYINIKYSFFKKLDKSVFLVCCFYGSDLLNNTFNYHDYQDIYGLLERANIVTCMSRYMKEIIKIKYSHNLNNKIRIINFGLNSELLENIKVLRFQKNQCKEIIKEYLKINSNKKMIFLGNSATPYNQQLEIIQNISNTQISKDILLILPMHYGNNPYLDQIKKICDQCGIEYIFLQEKLSIQLLSVFRCGVDLYIHVPITDSFGGTFHEFVYANTPVITGSWLFFEHLRNLKLNIKQIDHLNDFNNALLNIMYHDPIIEVNEDHELLLNYISHDKVKEKWLNCIPIDWQSKNE